MKLRLGKGLSNLNKIETRERSIKKTSFDSSKMKLRLGRAQSNLRKTMKIFEVRTFDLMDKDVPAYAKILLILGTKRQRK